MITHFIEASDGMLHGKFLLLRFDLNETRVNSALRGYESESIFRISGRRKWQPGMTFMADLQTGEGCAWFMDDPFAWTKLRAGGEHAGLWICPMYTRTLKWLLKEDTTDITKLPRYVEFGPGGEVVLTSPPQASDCNPDVGMSRNRRARGAQGAAA